MTSEPRSLPARWRAAAWLCLVVTLATGTLLRLQWTGRISPPFNSHFLLHGHSHVALLGWAFIGIFGLVFGRGVWQVEIRRTGAPDEWEDGSRTPREGQGAGTRAIREQGAGGDWNPRDGKKGGARNPSDGKLRRVGRLTLEGLFLILVLAMTLAFILEGYAPRSTALSLVHVIISLGLVWVYTGDVRDRLPTGARRWIDLSMAWFVVAQLGPLLLAGGVWMGPAWIDAWVGYYLAVLFNGWLTFAAIGLLVAGGHLDPAPWVRPWMAIGVLPTAAPALQGWFTIPMGPWIGWGGHLLLGGGLLVVAWRTLGEGGVGEGLLHRSVVGALLLLGLLMPVGTLPGLHEQVMATPNLVIGFVHLQLLGLVTATLLLCLYPRRRSSLPVHLFLAGGWAMILTLLGVGMANLAGRSVHMPVQEILTLTGAVALLGVLLLPLAREPVRDRHPRVGP